MNSVPQCRVDPSDALATANALAHNGAALPIRLSTKAVCVVLRQASGGHATVHLLVSRLLHGDGQAS
jgi:hypothetical protein